jgi:hypothetical protein
VRVNEALTVRRWRRFGADRLYVTADNGMRVGVVDLQSGEVSVDLPVLEDGVRRAVQAYLRADLAELVLPFDAALELAALDGFDPGDPSTDRRERGGSVRTRLERLTAEGWQVVHAVPLGRQGNVVEHLIVGPGGIFTVREHAHPGVRISVDGRTIEVDGQPVSYLRDARLEAGRVQRLLREAVGSQLTVKAVLVLQALLDTDESDGPPADALLVERHDVPGVFRTFPERLEPARIDAIAAIARQRTTWAR